MCIEAKLQKQKSVFIQKLLWNVDVQSKYKISEQQLDRRLNKWKLMYFFSAPHPPLTLIR